MEGVQIIVCVSRDVWDEFYISTSKFSSCEKPMNTTDGSERNIPRNYKSGLNSSKNFHNCFCPYESCTCVGQDSNFLIEGKPHETKEKMVNVRQCYKTKMNGYAFSLFVRILKSSEFYRSAVISHLLQCKSIEQNKYSSWYPLKLIIQLYYPQKDIIDYSWNERMLTMALERRELDHAMSWFSTLGGAFSALGDHFDYCAIVAGRISIEQMKLALRLGDPMTVARCKLYLSLSLLQRGYLKCAKHIIKEQYILAKTAQVLDMRLIRMCHGIWAKLKYMYHVRVEKNV